MTENHRSDSPPQKGEEVVRQSSPSINRLISSAYNVETPAGADDNIRKKTLTQLKTKTLITHDVNRRHADTCNSAKVLVSAAVVLVPTTEIPQMLSSR